MLKIHLEDQIIDIPVENNTINAALFGKLTKLRIFDKSLKNTVVAKTMISNATSYRGIPIESLMESSSYLETSYLLIYGKLPSLIEHEKYKSNILKHTYVHIDLRQQLETFRYNAHPTSMLIALLAATSTLHPESNPALMGETLYKSGPHENKLESYPIKATSPTTEPSEAVRDFVRDKQIYRMIGKISTLTAAVYRHRLGRPYNEPKSDARSYAENLLYMIDKLNEVDFQPDPVLVNIVDKLFILLAEDSSVCSTAAMRHLISSGVDPYSAIAGSISTLLGENKASNVYYWLRKNLKSSMDIPSAVELVKLIYSGSTVYGFQTTVNLKVKWMKSLAQQVYKHLHDINKESLYELSEELELKLQTENIYLSLDYWTAVLLYLMGFSTDMFPAIISIPRVSGLMAHALESIDDPDYKIFRPRQIYTGYELRSYPESAKDIFDLKKRSSALELVNAFTNSSAARRRTAAFDNDLLMEINQQILDIKKQMEEISFTIQQNNKTGVFSLFKKDDDAKSLSQVF